MTLGYYPASQLSSLASALNEGGRIEWNGLHRADHDFRGVIFRRQGAAAPELDGDWTDIYYIIDGEVNHQSGDTRESSASVRLAAGDIASVAAGVPHWWEVEPGRTVAYLTIKVLRRPCLTNRAFVHFKADDLRNFVDMLKRGEPIAFPRVHRGDHDFQGIAFRSADSNAPEMHRNWADLLFVLDGDVTMQYGDRLDGGVEAADGEVRGGVIAGHVKRQRLAAGDVASAAAGVPHFWEVERGKTVTYLAVKLRAGSCP